MECRPNQVLILKHLVRRRNRVRRISHLNKLMKCSEVRSMGQRRVVRLRQRHLQARESRMRARHLKVKLLKVRTL